MANISPETFSPTPGKAQLVSATATSSSTDLTGTIHDNVVLIRCIAATDEVFIRVGDGAQTAVVDTDLQLRVGDTFLWPIGNTETFEFAAVCRAAETASFQVITGILRR